LHRIAELRDSVDIILQAHEVVLGMSVHLLIKRLHDVKEGEQLLVILKTVERYDGVVRNEVWLINPLLHGLKMEISEHVSVFLSGPFSFFPLRLEPSTDWISVEYLMSLTFLRLVGQTSHEAGTLVQYFDIYLFF
jgi:hypothetical protein